MKLLERLTGFAKKVEAIPGSLDAIAQAIRENTSRPDHALEGRQTREFWLHVGEVLGLWAAAAVGVWAILSSRNDSEQQRSVMRGQLDEMRAEQRPNLWVVSDVGAPQFFDQSGQVVWTIHLTNYGKNFVARGVVHKFILLGDSGFVKSHGEPDDLQITPVAPGQVITYSIVSNPGVTAERFNALLAITGGIQIKLERQLFFTLTAHT